MLPTAELFEHQLIEVGAPLRTVGGGSVTFTAEHLASLARFNDANDGAFFRLGHRCVTTTEHVGYVEVGGLAIEILPKADRPQGAAATASFWRDGLLDMLRVGRGLKLQRPAAASQRVGRSTLLELVVVRFLELTERLLHEGLAKGYRDEVANGPAFRGRLLVTENIRSNAARADRFFVRFAAFDRDVAVNRVLRAALDAIPALGVSVATLARGQRARAEFPEVSRPRASELMAELPLGRSTERYREALDLARLILANRAPELRAGRRRVFALLFDMNDLWERYVGALFRRAAGADLVVSTQESAAFWRSDGGTRWVRPDIVVRRGGSGRDEVVLIADTKWKVPQDGAPSIGDLQQMFVYNELLSSPEAILLYPSAGTATDRTGTYHARTAPAHRCVTRHLGIVDEHGWRAERIEDQIRAILDPLRPQVANRA